MKRRPGSSWAYVLALFLVVNVANRDWGWVIFDLLFLISFVLGIETRETKPQGDKTA